jgi:hypothetical protein
MLFVISRPVPSFVGRDFTISVFVGGGRPRGSKRKLNFQSATWHHLEHFPSWAEGDQPVIGVGAASWLQGEQYPCWYLDLFERGLLVAILRPKNVKSELRHPDLV